MNIKQAKEFQIGGAKRLIKFGTNASAIFCEKYSISLSEYQSVLKADTIQIGHLRDLIWSGLVAGAKYEKKEVDFDAYDVGDWLDDVDESVVEQITALLNPGGEDKKKAKKP